MTKAELPHDVHAQDPQEHALETLYTMAVLDPEASLEGLSDLRLREFAVYCMEQSDLERAGEYRGHFEAYMRKRAQDAFDGLVEDGRHAALSAAVRLASNLLSVESLAVAWYAREEVAEQTSSPEDDRIDFEGVKAVLDEVRSDQERYLDPYEFEIALKLASQGFEGIEPALLRHYIERLATVRQAIHDGSMKSEYMILPDRLTDAEEKLLRPRTHDKLYLAIEIMHQRINANPNLSEALKVRVESETHQFYEDEVFSILADPKLRGKRILLACKMAGRLYAADPRNKAYRTLHRRLNRHFQAHQLGILKPLYRKEDIQYAFEALNFAGTTDNPKDRTGLKGQ